MATVVAGIANPFISPLLNKSSVAPSHPSPKPVFGLVEAAVRLANALLGGVWGCDSTPTHSAPWGAI